MRSVTILGATGSIGRSTLDLIQRAPDRFSVTAVTAQSNVACLAEIARANHAGLAVIGDETLYSALVDALAGSGVEAAAGPAAVEAAAARDADWTMAAIVGSAGLRPTMAAVRRGGAVALANKESLVCAGDLLTAAARAHGATMLPVDSEHNAIYQCFDHAAPHRIARVILTASGGPFRQWSRAEMAVATPEQAVRHPNWSMGAKISVDSATLINKGLELIEAYHLFPIEVDQLDVIVHPQSVIHSMVEYIDGSVLAQMGTPDMRTPIAYTLAWPERMETPCPRLDFATVGSLDFEPPDLERFPALSLARSALATGGTAPAILNAANEVAVASFLARRIGFLDIAAIVAETMRRLSSSRPESLDHIFAIDAEARVVAQSAMEAQAA